jgi:hypothetical protein
VTRLRPGTYLCPGAVLDRSGPALRAKTAGVVGVPPVISTRHARRRTFGIEFRRHRATSAGPLAPKPGDSLLAQYGL